jgi:hypothetical protein
MRAFEESIRMWKFVRNMLLLTVALAAALQLLLWVAAQQQSGAISAQLAPWLDLKYASASAGLDGTLRLKDVQVTMRHGPWRDPFVAESLRIRAGGPLWLLTRAVSRGDDFPAEVKLEGYAVRVAPSLAKSVGAWINTKSGVPFDDFGCGKPFSDADYVAMQHAVQPATLTLHLERDAAAKSLQIDAGFVDKPFARLHVRMELKPFDFAMLDDAKALTKGRVASASLGWSDEGYFAARNRYCAQRLGASVDGYLDRHLAAVTDFLAAHEIVASTDALGLYRILLNKGGEVQLLSLPNASVAPTTYADYDRAEVLRFLNLTARHDQAPPVLFKLGFLAPTPKEPEAITVTATPPPTTSSTPPGSTISAASTPAPVVPAVTPAGSSPAAAPMLPKQVATVAPVPAPPPSVPTPTKPSAPVASTSRDAVLDKPGASPVLPAAPPKAPPPPVTPPVLVATPTDSEKLRDPVTGKPLESAPPPENASSTAAMVWKSGVVERLPESGPRELPYIVTALESLENRSGEYVILVTEGGKEIEGVLVGVTRENATVRVRRESGTADLDVPRARIREVRQPRARE